MQTIRITKTTKDLLESLVIENIATFSKLYVNYNLEGGVHKDSYSLQLDNTDDPHDILFIANELLNKYPSPIDNFIAQSLISAVTAYVELKEEK